MAALKIDAISLDGADPSRLGSFFRRLPGGEILWSNEGSVGVRATSVVLVAQHVHPYTPPEWPGASILHFDVGATPDLEKATARAVKLGATLVEPQPDIRWNRTHLPR